MLMGEAVEKTGLSADTLRYYERMGLIPPVPRTESGQRDYTGEIIEWISFIRRFRAIGMPLESISAYVKLAMAGSDTRLERKRLLIETRRSQVRKIEDLRASLERTDELLRGYENSLLPETENFAGLLRGLWNCAGTLAV